MINIYKNNCESLSEFNYNDYIRFMPIDNKKNNPISIKKEEIIKLKLANSKIMECYILNNGVNIITKFKYMSILKTIYNTMTINDIMKYKTFNIKEGNVNGLNGYNYSKKLNLSIQSKATPFILFEILNMTEINEFPTSIIIKLDSGVILQFINSFQNVKAPISNNSIYVYNRNPFYTVKDISKLKLVGSRILECIVKNTHNFIITTEKKYMSILVDIYSSMSVNDILNNTSFNIKYGDENGKNGYNYHKKLNMSIQPKPTNHILVEIFKMADIYTYPFSIKIQLDTNEIIHIVNQYYK